MYIIIKDNNKLNNFEIKDKKISYKGINIYKNDIYYISLDKDLYFADGEKIKKLEIKKYIIKNDKKYYSLELYVYEAFDKGYSLYKNQNFLLASDSRANIEIKDDYLKNYYLYYKNGHIESNYHGLLLNGRLYQNEKLKENDHIQMLSFSFFYNKDFFYISNHLIFPKLEKYLISPQQIKYRLNYLNINNSILETSIEEIKLDDIKKYPTLKQSLNRNIYSQISSALMMSLILLTISIYNLRTSNSFIYILMPIGMFMTGVLLPLILHLIDKTKVEKENKIIKNEYLNYLNDIYEDRKNIIIKYAEIYNKQIFRFNQHKDNLSITSKSIYYLSINLGFKEKELIYNYSYTDDKEINKRIDDIKDLSKISNYPVNLELKNNKYISIVTNKANKDYIFHKILLSFIYLHSFEDVNVAVYWQDYHLDSFLYNIPHLFIGNERMTLKSNKELIELDQLKLDKPLILFLYDKCNYKCLNDNIITIYFSTSKEDILKDSDAVVLFEHNKGKLITKDIQEFNYFIEDTDFHKHYSYLGLYNNNLKPKEIYSFKNIYPIENIEMYYKQKAVGLEASFAYCDNELFTLDIHEDKAGPHGLIGGVTGSGKSELIISFLLSLAIKYSPEYLNMIIIDYKGGSLIDSLSYDEQIIPHVVASITNLQKNNMNRLLLRIKKELEDREELFKKLSLLSKSPISNLDMYIEKHKDYELDNISHLIIVVDEFAELKKEHPDYIKELISISRIGRSLGIHLILATQKPGGNIDDQIYSNSHFKIALKTIEESDSIEIIKRKDATYLKERGDFCILIDDVLKKANSIYSKNDYFGNEAFTVKLLDNKLRQKSFIAKKFIQKTFESSIYIKEIINITNKLKLKVKKINFEEREALTINHSNITNKFFLGQSDDYYNQIFNDIYVDIDADILIYTNRKNEINYYINTLNNNKRRMIIISDKTYKSSYICDCIRNDNDDDIDYLFRYLLNNEINNMTLIIEDINIFLTYKETYLENIIKIIKRKTNEDFNIIIFSNNSLIPFKLLNYFNHKFAIDITNNNDLINIFNTNSKYLGASYYYENEVITYIPSLIDKYEEKEKIVFSIIKKIPESIKAKIVDDKCLIGYELESREEIYLDIGYPLNIISLKKNLLHKYESYKYQLDIYDSIDRNKINNILWIGRGIFKQNLFMPLINRDLKDDEGYLLIEGEYRIVKVINDV